MKDAGTIGYRQIADGENEENKEEQEQGTNANE